MSRKLELIVLVLIILFAAQFFYISSTTNSKYGGADDKPEQAIHDITGGTYKPIAKPIWEPPSGEIDSLIFALQAAFGAKILARTEISPYRKDVLAKMSGGDRTRKDKLLEAQKKGKTRMINVSKVEIPQKALLSMLQS